MIKSIARINPIDEMRQMAEMMDRLFAAPANPTESARVAPMDVLEKDGKLVIRAALPGVAPEDIKVNFEDGVLTVEGECKQDETTEDTRVYRRECLYGKFTRSIRLTDDLNLDEIDAEFKNGIVLITIPKVVEEKKTMTIPVRTEK